MNPRLLATALSLSLALGAGLAVAADENAQQPGPPPLATLVKPLKLSAAQQQKLKPLIEATRGRVREDMDAARRNDQRLDSAEFTAQVKTREADLREKLQGVLSADQLARYDSMSEERTPQRAPAVTVHGHHEMDTPQTARER